MGNLIADLNNSQNWVIAYDEVKIAQQLSNGYYVPIPDFQLPTQFESPILLFETDCPDAKPWWWLAGRARMSLAGPGIVADEVFAARRKIPINRPSMIRFPKLLNQYNVTVSIVPWLQQVRVTCWEFIGTIGDSTDQLIQENTDLVRVDLLRVETKIDQL